MSDHVLIAAPAEQARERLLAQVRRDGLRGAVADALAHGKELPAPLAVPVQELTVRTLPTYRSGAATVIPFRWYTNSDFDDRYPVVDANLQLEQTEPGTSRLSLTGIYHPATAPSGGTLPQDDTPAAIRRFLGRLADILAPGQPRTRDEARNKDNHQSDHASAGGNNDAALVTPAGIGDSNLDLVSLKG